MSEVQKQQQPLSNWVDIHGVCEHLKISKETIYRMVRDRTIPFHKINSALRFDLNEVDIVIKRDDYKFEEDLDLGPDFKLNLKELSKTESPAKRNVSSPNTSASKGRKSVKKKVRKKR